MGSVSQVEPNLFLSDARAAESLSILQAHNITHVLVVDRDTHQPCFPNDVTYAFVPVFDVEEERISRFFAEAIAFIQDALAGQGTVLVHCTSGVSRSPTIVAAYLMYTHRISATAALEHLRRVREFVEPNDGFLSQLKAYQAVLGIPETDEATDSETQQRQQDAHVQSRLLDIARRREEEGTVEVSDLSGDPAALISREDIRLYTCRLCNRPLFTPKNVARHEMGRGTSAFSHKKTAKEDHFHQKVECTSYFIEPMAWMRMLDNVEGKLMCPKCDTRLGTFRWQGAQCSCGAWITPAFQIVKKNVDERIFPHASH